MTDSGTDLVTVILDSNKSLNHNINGEKLKKIIEIQSKYLDNPVETKRMIEKIVENIIEES